MSRGGGGAGKVYFILYLAVVLELLIIIVERDEAEEGLLKKQKETMRIVESILAQLQSGAGTEGINTRPQDEITIPPPGVNIEEIMGADIKSFRKYIVEVGVTDISNELKRKEGETEKDYITRIKKLVELANVEEIEYQVFFSSNPDPNNAPMFPNEQEIKKNNIDFKSFKPGDILTGPNGDPWEFLSMRRLKLDKEATFNNLNLENLTPEAINPIYPGNEIIMMGPSFIPANMPDDSAFFYSIEESRQRMGIGASGELKKRAFVVNFQPPSIKGWYKLRFSSRTNRILGVRADIRPEELSDETTINIGTVQLTVRDLNKVRKELTSKLEKFNLPSYESLVQDGNLEQFDQKLKEAKEVASRSEDATDLISKINLYGYIAKLLAPGQSVNFDQNRGSIEFNVRVITPTPTIADPVVGGMPDYWYTFDKVPAVFEFSISPYQGGNTVEGRVIDNNGATVARIDCRSRDQIAGTGATPPIRGGRAEYRGTVDQTLAPNTEPYTMEITHKLSGKQKTESCKLYVFPTGLSAESEKQINSYLGLYTRYGQNLVINAEPSSGGKIKSNQFRIYLNSDVDQQRQPIESYTMAQSDGLYLSYNTNKVTAHITWIQPYTGTEVDLFPEKSYEVDQKLPRINHGDKSVTVSGQEKKISIRMSNITVTGSAVGNPDDKAAVSDVEAKLGKASIEVQGYEIAGDPVIEKNEGGKYTIYIELTGKLPRGEDKVKGTVTVKMYAQAVNKLNNKISKEDVKDVSYRLNYEPERQQRGPAGGTRRPPR